MGIANTAQLQCSLPPSTPPSATDANPVPPVVWVKGYGYASVSGGIALDLAFRVESVLPASGSWGGGTVITLHVRD